MKFVVLIIIGVLGGTLGGMGMGGGTLLIPLLTTVGGVSQHAAQSINLAAFLPMAAVAIIIHAQKKLIDTRTALIVAVPALITAVPMALVALRLDSGMLSRLFGGFLLLLGIYQLICAVRNKSAGNQNAKN